MQLFKIKGFHIMHDITAYHVRGIIVGCEYLSMYRDNLALWIIYAVSLKDVSNRRDWIERGLRTHENTLRIIAFAGYSIS